MQQCLERLRLLQKNGTCCCYILLTYLIDHNNPINGFWTAATHSSRRLCFLRAYASWLHKSMTELPRFGHSNGYSRLQQIPASNTRLARASSSIRTTWPSKCSRWILTCCTESQVVEELIQLTIEQNAEIIASAHQIEDLTYDFSLEYSQGCCASVLNRVHASAPQRSTGRMSVLQSIRFVVQERSLLLNCPLRPLYIILFSSLFCYIASLVPFLIYFSAEKKQI